MRKRDGIATVLAAVLALWGCHQATPGATAQSTSQAEAADSVSLAGFASVVDGDTIEIHSERIRLSGFDTPERGKHCGEENVYQRAANELDSFLAGRTVQCTRRGGDDYGRTVATRTVGGVDLGDYMVSRGWARDWPRYSGGEYGDEEAEARAASRGLWGLQCPADLWSGRDYSAQ